MMILRPVPVKSSLFAWVPETRTFAADISDLGGQFGRVYDDACDEGLTLESSRHPGIPDPPVPGPAFAGLTMTAVTRQVIHLAARGGLRPHLGRDGARPDRYGRVLVYVDGEGKNAMFGGFYVSARTGRILRAYLTPGNSGTERRYETVAAIRAALRDWFSRNQITV